MNISNKDLVKGLYTDCLTVNTNTNVTIFMENLLSDNFQSHGTEEIKDKRSMIGMVPFLWKTIPDLKWDPQEIIESNDKVIVRSIFSGTPNGDFMGIKLDGTKSFKSMSIDIHTIKNGKIESIYHIEDWSTVMKQLKG